MCLRRTQRQAVAALQAVGAPHIYLEFSDKDHEFSDSTRRRADGKSGCCMRANQVSASGRRSSRCASSQASIVGSRFTADESKVCCPQVVLIRAECTLSGTQSGVDPVTHTRNAIRVNDRPHGHGYARARRLWKVGEHMIGVLSRLTVVSFPG